MSKYDLKLIQWQSRISTNQEKHIVIFEGRDCSGKSSCIRSLMRYMPTKDVKVIALTKPTIQEQQDWYWSRFLKYFPNPGETTLWDRSWYNRAMIEPIMGFCSHEQTEQFYNECSKLEKMWIDSGYKVTKIYFTVSPEIQLKRYNDRLNDPLKHNKISEADRINILLYDEFTKHEKVMFERTSTKESPWNVINGNDKVKARRMAIEIITKK